MSDLISDGNVPHPKMKGAGEPEPILRLSKHDCLKCRDLLNQLFLNIVRSFLAWAMGVWPLILIATLRALCTLLISAVLLTLAGGIV